MGTIQRPNRLFWLVISCLFIMLAACSSGGGGKSSPQSSGDTRPDSFTLAAPNGVDLEKVGFNTWINSAQVTITGIDAAAPVSIENGEYAIGEGEFTSASGTVRNGQQIHVRVQSPVKAEQTAAATLNIGGETATFTVTTGPDTVPPEVSILFPPPASMTEGATLFMRGTVKDANGTLEEGAVTVNGVEAELDLNDASDEGTWEVTVNLAPGENTVAVAAADTAEKVNDGESVSSRRVASIAGESFPDNSIPLAGPISLDIHEIDGNPVALVTDRTTLAVIAVDLDTGKRSVFSSNEVQMDNPFRAPWNIHVGENGQIYVFDWVIEEPRIYALDGAGTRTLFLENSESEQLIEQPFGMYLSETESGTYLYLADRSALTRIDVATKNKVVVSDSVNGVPNLDNPITDAIGMVYDKNSGRFLIVSIGNQRLFFVDVETGHRTAIEIDEPLIVSGGALLNGGEALLAVETTEDRVSIIDIATGAVSIISGPGVGGINAFSEPRGIVMYSNGEYALIVDRALKAIVALDIESHQQVIVSKSE